MSMTKKALLTAGAVIALSTGLPGGQARAAPTYCNQNGNGFQDFPGGNAGPLALSAISGGNCVQVQDKIVGGFVDNFGNLPSNADVRFLLSMPVPGVDLHSVTFDGAFSGTVATGVTYGFTWDVTDTSGPNITALDGDFTQSTLSTATSTMLKTTVPVGSPTAIDFQKTGNTKVAGGNSVISFSPGVTTLEITDTLTSHDTVTNILNDVTEGTPIPEPASLGLLGIGLIGLGVFRRRAKRE